MTCRKLSTPKTPPWVDLPVALREVSGSFAFSRCSISLSMRGVGYEWNFETELRYLKWMQNLMEPSFLRTRTAGLHQSQGWMIPRDNMRSTSFFSGPRRCSGILKRLHLTIPHLLTQCHQSCILLFYILAQGKLKCCPPKMTNATVRFGVEADWFIYLQKAILEKRGGGTYLSTNPKPSKKIIGSYLAL